jgi:hypothetical protein
VSKGISASVSTDGTPFVLNQAAAPKQLSEVPDLSRAVQAAGDSRPYTPQDQHFLRSGRKKNCAYRLYEGD